MFILHVLFLTIIVAVTSSVPKHCVGCDFTGVDLHGQDLRDARWVGSDLRGANLRDVNLSGANLAGVSLRDVDLTGADLRNARLAGADLRGARFDGARLDGIELAGVNLADSVLNQVNDDQLRALLGNCAGCDLKRVDLHGKDLHGIRVVGSDFQDANLRDTNLSGAVLCAHEVEVDDDGTSTYGRVVCADLDGADLRGANLRGVQTCDGGRHSPRRCTNVDAATLRSVAHANLNGVQGI